MGISMGEGYQGLLLRSAPTEGKGEEKEARIWQGNMLGCDAVKRQALASHMGSSESRMTLYVFKNSGQEAEPLHFRVKGE